MGIGFGVLKQMNDTIRANRAMLGKKKSVRELYKEEIKNRKSTFEKQTLEQVRARVAERVKQNRISEIFSRITAVLILVVIVGGVAWIISIIDFNRRVKELYNKEDLFTTILYDQPDGMVLKTDYYPGGPRAAETFLKNNLRHQNAESYYESGQQFRSALYYYDTLIREIFLFKNGDTIKNFPVVDRSMVVKVTLIDKKRLKKIELLIFDDKILQDSYKELEYTK